MNFKEQNINSVEPAVPATDSDLIVSFSTFTTASYDGMDLEIETVDTSRDQGIPDSEAPEGKSLSTYLTPIFGPKDIQNMGQMFGWLSEFEVQDRRFKLRMRYMKKYETEVIASRLSR